MAVDASTTAGYPRSMTAAAKAVLEQAMQLTEQEREELANDLLASIGPQPPSLTRAERDRRIAVSLAQIARGEDLAEEDVIDEINAL